MLIRISEEVVDFPDVVSGGFVTEWIQAEKPPLFRVTEIGRSFLAFIAEPPQSTD